MFEKEEIIENVKKLMMTFSSENTMVNGKNRLWRYKNG